MAGDMGRLRGVRVAGQHVETPRARQYGVAWPSGLALGRLSTRQDVGAVSRPQMRTGSPLGDNKTRPGYRPPGVADESLTIRVALATATPQDPSGPVSIRWRAGPLAQLAAR